jgi:hypothetical protein
MDKGGRTWLPFLFGLENQRAEDMKADCKEFKDAENGPPGGAAWLWLRCRTVLPN